MPPGPHECPGQRHDRPALSPTETRGVPDSFGPSLPTHVHRQSSPLIFAAPRNTLTYETVDWLGMLHQMGQTGVVEMQQHRFRTVLIVWFVAAAAIASRPLTGLGRAACADEEVLFTRPGYTSAYGSAGSIYLRDRDLDDFCTADAESHST